MSNHAGFEWSKSLLYVRLGLANLRLVRLTSGQVASDTVVLTGFKHTFNAHHQKLGAKCGVLTFFT